MMSPADVFEGMDVDECIEDPDVCECMEPFGNGVEDGDRELSVAPMQYEASSQTSFSVDEYDGSDEEEDEVIPYQPVAYVRAYDPGFTMEEPETAPLLDDIDDEFNVAGDQEAGNQEYK